MTTKLKRPSVVELLSLPFPSSPPQRKRIAAATAVILRSHGHIEDNNAPDNNMIPISTDSVVIIPTLKSSSIDGSSISIFCNKIGSVLFPPIPIQKETIKWQDNFISPKFIANELYIGAKYMSERMFILYVAAFLTRCFVWPDSATMQAIDAVTATTTKFKFGRKKSAITWGIDFSKLIISLGGCGLQIDSIVNKILLKKQVYNSIFVQSFIKPIVEEISYRGIEFPVQYFNSWFTLLSFSWFSGKISWRTGLLSLILQTYFIGSKLVSSMSINNAFCISPNSGKKIFFFLIPVVTFLSIIPDVIEMLMAQIPLMMKARQNQHNDKLKNDDCSFSSSSTSNSNQTQPPQQNTNDTKKNRIVSLVYPATSTGRKGLVKRKEEKEEKMMLTNRIKSTLLLTSRLKTSLLFGIAHIGSPVLYHEWYIRLQKYVGTFASSFLIESRLLIQRRTLWSPIGAHMFFNLIPALLQFASICVSNVHICNMITITFLGILFIRSLKPSSSTTTGS